MHERELNNLGRNDAVVAIPLPQEGQGDRTDKYCSRVTRDGSVSLEIEIPCDGITCEEVPPLQMLTLPALAGCDRCYLLIPVTVAFAFVFAGIVLSAIAIISDGAVGLARLAISACSVLFILVTLSIFKDSSFSYTSLKITRHNYCLTRRGITWKSCFQITCLPTHFNDLESGQFVETDPKESEFVRDAGLRAEIETHVVMLDQHDRSVTKDIKLGSISFAEGLDDEELGWLVEQINSFLQET